MEPLMDQREWSQKEAKQKEAGWLTSEWVQSKSMKREKRIWKCYVKKGADKRAASFRVSVSFRVSWTFVFTIHNTCCSPTQYVALKKIKTKHTHTNLYIYKYMYVYIYVPKRNTNSSFKAHCIHSCIFKQKSTRGSFHTVCFLLTVSKGGFLLFEMKRPWFLRLATRHFKECFVCFLTHSSMYLLNEGISQKWHFMVCIKCFFKVTVVYLDAAL